MRRKLYMILLGLLCIIPAIARDFTYEGLTYTVIDEEAKTCMTKEGDGFRPGNNVSGDIVIPAYVNDGTDEYHVVAIGEWAFDDCSGMTSVVLPGSVIAIEERAFSGCSGMTSVVIPESVITIGEEAFWCCSALTTVVIPESVTTIRECAFYGCSGLRDLYFNAENCKDFRKFSYVFPSTISNVYIGDKVKVIPACAFWYCSALTTVVIPESVTTIGECAFDGCSGLRDLYYNAAECIIIDSSAFPSTLEKITIGDKVKLIPQDAFILRDVCLLRR